MSEETTLTKLSDIQWLGQWTGGIQQKLGAKFTISIEDGMTISEDATEEDQQIAAQALARNAHNSETIARVLHRSLGDLILHYSEQQDISWEHAIIGLGLENQYAKPMSYFKTLARIAQVIDKTALNLEGLRFSHFDAAVKFRAPQEPEQKRQWNERVSAILHEAAQAPAERGARWVQDKMRALQAELASGPAKPTALSAKDLLTRHYQLSYMLNHWTEDQFDMAGHSRGEVRDWCEACEVEMTERNLVDVPDAEHFVAPWSTRPALSAPVIELSAAPEPTDDELPIIED